MRSTWPHWLVEHLRAAEHDKAELRFELDRLREDRERIARERSIALKQLEAANAHAFETNPRMFPE